MASNSTSNNQLNQNNNNNYNNYNNYINDYIYQHLIRFGQLPSVKTVSQALYIDENVAMRHIHQIRSQQQANQQLLQNDDDNNNNKHQQRHQQNQTMQTIQLNDTKINEIKIWTKKRFDNNQKIYQSHLKKKFNLTDTQIGFVWNEIKEFINKQVKQNCINGFIKTELDLRGDVNIDTFTNLFQCSIDDAKIIINNFKTSHQ